MPLILTKIVLHREMLTQTLDQSKIIMIEITENYVVCYFFFSRQSLRFNLWVRYKS